METVQITCPQTGSLAKILPEVGFNCYQFQAASGTGPIEVLWADPEFEKGGGRPSGSGIPLLFPFPGRIGGEVFPWEGREYRLQAGDGRGNAIHGFVLDRPWRVIEREPSRVVGQFQASVDDPEVLNHWPSDFRITATYEIDGTTLKSEFVMENPGDAPLPCGFGTHPYFRLPLGGDQADDCVVQLPVSERWVLSDMLPTGEREPLAGAEAYPQGLRFGEMQFDDVLTGLHFDGDHCTARVQDPHGEHELTLEFDRAFRECVVFTPPHREAVCIEPYTCAPDAAKLAQQNIDAGLRVLAPGESFACRVTMRLR